MNYLIKNLGLDNCIKFNIGNTEILLDSFRKNYQGGFGTDNIILHNKERFFNIGYIGEENKLAQDIIDSGYEIISLRKYIEDLIYEKVIGEMFNYVEEIKDKELFETVGYFYDYSSVGKNPLSKIREQINIEMYFDKLVDDEIVIDSWNKDGVIQELKFNICYNKFYINDDITNEETEQKIIFNRFCSESMKTKYVLYYRYINNLLKNNDLGYKEIADLNKWVEEKQAKSISIVYDMNGIEMSRKINANIDKMFSSLSRTYYKEMVSFCGVDDISSITQIKGFKYGKDYHIFNSENLLYKEVK